MLDEVEFRQVASLYSPDTWEPDEWPYGPMRREYERITGVTEQFAGDILHHRLALYGPPCKRCTKLLRKPWAKLCGSCMAPIAPEDRVERPKRIAKERHMSASNEQEIFSRFPELFVSNNQIAEPAMSRGFDCGDGWHGIVLQLLERLALLSPHAEIGPALEVLQAKQKFGALRIAVNYTSPAIEGAIQEARQRSIRTCEICGCPDHQKMDDQGWWATRCDSCRGIPE